MRGFFYFKSIIIGNVVYIGSSIVDCGSTGASSILAVPSINRAYNHALTPESNCILSKESSIVKEIGQHTKLMLCSTLTTSTFSILKWIIGCPKIVSLYPKINNYTIEYQIALTIPKDNRVSLA